MGGCDPLRGVQVPASTQVLQPPLLQPSLSILSSRLAPAAGVDYLESIMSSMQQQQHPREVCHSGAGVAAHEPRDWTRGDTETTDEWRRMWARLVRALQNPLEVRRKLAKRFSDGALFAGRCYSRLGRPVLCR